MNLSKLFSLTRSCRGWCSGRLQAHCRLVVLGGARRESPTLIVGENSTNIVDCDLPQDTGGFNPERKCRKWEKCLPNVVRINQTVTRCSLELNPRNLRPHFLSSMVEFLIHRPCRRLKHQPVR